MKTEPSDSLRLIAVLWLSRESSINLFTRRGLCSVDGVNPCLIIISYCFVGSVIFLGFKSMPDISILSGFLPAEADTSLFRVPGASGIDECSTSSAGRPVDQEFEFNKVFSKRVIRKMRNFSDLGGSSQVRLWPVAVRSVR